MSDRQRTKERRAQGRALALKRTASEASGHNVVRGRIVTASGTPAVSVRLTAHDRDASGENTLGTTVSDSQGHYSISYSESAFRLSRNERGGADVFLRVYDGEGQLLLETKVRRNAPRDYVCNIQLPPERFVVRGTVRDSAGLPVAEAVVVAFDKDMRSEEPLGQATSDRDGHYYIQYAQEQFARSEKASADLRVAVLGPRKKEIASSPIRYNAKADETVDIVVEGSARTASEYERLTSLLTPLTQDVPFAQLTEDDIAFLVGDTGEAEEKIRALRVAAKLAVEAERPEQVRKPRARTTTELQAEVFYGWLRRGLPQALPELLALDTSKLVSTLRSAIAGKIVPPISADGFKDLQATIDRLRRRVALQPAPEGASPSLGDLLATMPTRLPSAKLEIVAETAWDDKVSDEEVAKRLKKSRFTKDEIASVLVTRALGTLTERHLGLMRALQGLRGDAGDGSLRFLAALTPVQWQELAALHGGDGEAGATGLELRAEQLERAIEARFPTAVLVARTEAGVIQWSDSAFGEAVSVLARNPECELDAGNVRQLVDGADDVEDKESIVQCLQQLQRARKMAGNWRETAALVNNGFGSALSVTEVSPTQFQEALSTTTSPGRALAIYAEAQRLNDVVIALIANAHGGAAPIGAIGGVVTEAPLPDAGRYPNLRRLFGNLTTCECSHCQSVLSPAAYLVDLLRFLDPKNRNTLPPISTLLARRPDIADIELSCSNATTEIPYIDLVNEVLENAIGLPIEVPAPYGFDPQADLARSPLPSNVQTELRKVLQRSAVTVGDKLTSNRNQRQLLIGTFVDWTVTDGARRWNLRHSPQSLSVLVAGILPRSINVADYVAARNALDQGQLPDIAWLIPPDNSPRAANLPLKSSPVITQVRAGVEWKATFSRAVRVTFVMGTPMSAVVLKTADGQTQLSAHQFPTAMAQRVLFGLQNQQIVDPLLSLLPEGLPYQISTATVGQWNVTVNYEMPIRYTAERLQITSLAYQTSERLDDLLSMPENRNPEAYDRLSSAVYPWSLPFNLWLTEVREFLQRRGIARRELMEVSRPGSRLSDEAVARELLGLSLAEWDIVCAANPGPAWEYWGLKQSGNRVIDRNDEQRAATGSWTAVLGYSVSILMQQAGLTYRELMNVLQTQFVRAVAPVLTPTGDACNPSKMKLQGLKPEHLDRIHRFVRLWRSVGGPLFELDAAIAATKVNPGLLNEAALVRVANLRRLSELLGRPVNQLAGWWGSLTSSMRDFTATRPEGRSSYERLFLDPSTASPPDGAFALNAPGTEIAYANPAAPPLLASQAVTLCAALGITQAEFDALLAELTLRQELTGVLSLANIQSLLRNVQLASGLKTSIDEYLRMRRLLGTSIFATAASAVEFVEAVEGISRSGLSSESLLYLLRYKLGDPTTVLFPISWAASVLADVRRSLQTARQDVLAGADMSSALRQALSGIGWLPPLVEQAIALFAAEGLLEVEVPSTANVTIPAALANVIAFPSGMGRLIASPAITSSQWTAFNGANADPEVRAASTALRAKVTAFSAALPAIAHTLQSFEVPVFTAPFSSAGAPEIPASLAERCYFDSALKRIVFVGWMNAEDRSLLATAVSATAANAIQAQSDRYVEAVAGNRFFASAGDVRDLFGIGETSQTRCEKVLLRLLPYLYRRSLAERLGQALDLEPPVVLALLSDKLAPAAALAPLVASEFADSDTRTAVTPTAFSAQFRALCKLHKASIVLRTLKMRAEELQWLPGATATGPTFDALNLDLLPSAPGDANVAVSPVQQLVRLLELREHPQIGAEFLARLHFLLRFDAATLTTAQASATAQLDYLAAGLNSDLADVIWAAQTRLNLQWPSDYRSATRIAAVIGLLAQRLLAQAYQTSVDDVARALGQLAMAWPGDFRNPLKLGELLRLLAMAQRLGAKVDECVSLTQDAAQTANGPARPGAAEAALARRLLSARYSRQTWAEQLKQIVDPLRHVQRDALVAYLIANPPVNASGGGVWRSPEDLYEHYLIDPQMSACRVSSRIVHAVSAVQLFVQRCLLNLEPLVTPADIDAERWKWMKNYRVWEANRKVFLYPENWIEPELRDDKSEIFEDLEGQLQQSELDNERANELLKGYLKRLEDIANLAIVGMYVEKVTVLGEPEVRIHVVGRTRNQPSRFFYRRWLLTRLGNRWEPWESVALDGVKSDHILPFVMRGDVYIAWPEITQLAAEPGVGDNTAPGAKWRVQMSWIRRSGRGWTERLSSADRFEHPWVYGKDENQTFTFRVRTPRGNFTDIDCYGAGRDGALAYAGSSDAPSTADIPPFRNSNALNRTWPVIKVQVSGRVYASYAGGVYRGHPGATVRAFFKLNGTADEVAAANRDIQWDLDRGLRISGAPQYGSTPDVSGTTDANGRFSLDLGLPAYVHGDDLFGNNHDAGYFRQSVLRLSPTIELTISVPTRPDQSKSFPYKDPANNEAFQHYSELRCEHNFIFSLPGAAPGGESDRAVSITPVKTFRLYTADDAAWVPLSTAFSPLAAGVLTYGSGYKATTASQSGALTLPGSGNSSVALWTGASTPYYVLPAAPFDYQGAELAAYRDSSNSYLIRKQDASVDAQAASGRFQVIVDGHPRATEMRFEVALGGVTRLFDLMQQSWQSALAFDSHTPSVAVDGQQSITRPAIRFEPDEAQSPYASYNTELYFHVPLLIATSLSANQRFADAQQWFHLIFDPTTSDTTPGNARFWRYLPFRQHSQTKPIDELLTLLGDPDVPASDQEKQRITAQIETWLKNPFRPHAVARMRPRAYQMTVVFKYLDNLIAWGDSLFRQYSTESINEATHLYVLAAKLLGPRPQSIPRSTPRPALTYRQVDNQWDDFSNAWMEVEANVRLPRAVRVEGVGFLADSLGRNRGVSSLSTVGMLYFCVPHNEKMLSYWDKLEERLFNIRHCRNIEGIEQAVPLFQPPIDPALLVRAAAAGLDIASVLDAANAPHPLYRFSTLLQKANDICNEVKQLGGALLTALEKKDFEQISQMRSRQEIELLTAVTEVREAQIAESRANVEALRQSEKTAIARFTQFQRLLGKNDAQVPDGFDADVEQRSAIAVAKGEGSTGTNLGLTQPELDQIGFSEEAMNRGRDAGLMSTVAGLLHAYPDLNVGTPFFSSKYGGSNLGSIASAISAYFTTAERVSTHQANRNATIAQHQRRQDDWVFQSRMALKEIQQVRRQLIAAQIRTDISEKELANHRKQIKNAEETDRFLREKYTNRQLYQWMSQQLSGVYFRAYQLAQDVAKRAEQAFRYELGLTESSYVQYGSWDNLKKGLLAGERLSLDLKRMEAAYLAQNRREFEISKHISLVSLDPMALIALRETGRCEVSIPEVLFDLDFPGHYLRRLKMVGLTIPCVRGPYASVSCTLTLLRSSVRHSTAIDGQYGMDSAANEDPRFRELAGPIQSVVTSSAQQDSGLFETNLRDERFLPFEGAGAISTWRLEMPTQFRQFDYSTITDVILHFRYTAREGGSALRQACVGELRDCMNAIRRSAQQNGLIRMFSLRHEFPEQWSRLTRNETSNTARAEEFALAKTRFPTMFSGKDITLSVKKMDVCLVTLSGAAAPPKFPKVYLPSTPANAAFAPPLTDATSIGDVAVKQLDATYTGGSNVVVPDADDAPGWKLEIERSNLAAFSAGVRDVLLVCHYEVS